MNSFVYLKKAASSPEDCVPEANVQRSNINRITKPTEEVNLESAGSYFALPLQFRETQTEKSIKLGATFPCERTTSSSRELHNS